MKYLEAVDAIYDPFKKLWIDELELPVSWSDVPAKVTGDDQPWARATIRHADGFQASLAGDSGRRRWRRVGFLTVQVFSIIGQGKAEGYNLSQRIVERYEGYSYRSLWFRNVRIQEAGTSGGYEQINFYADFEYDEVR